MIEERGQIMVRDWGRSCDGRVEVTESEQVQEGHVDT